MYARIAHKYGLADLHIHVSHDARNGLVLSFLQVGKAVFIAAGLVVADGHNNVVLPRHAAVIGQVAQNRKPPIQFFFFALIQDHLITELNALGGQTVPVSIQGIKWRKNLGPLAALHLRVLRRKGVMIMPRAALHQDTEVRKIRWNK